MAARLLDDPRDAGAQQYLSATEQARVVFGLYPMKLADLFRRPVRLHFRVRDEVIAKILDTLFANSHRQQSAVPLSVPVPVQAGILECVIECDAVTVAFGIGEGTVYVEDERFQLGHCPHRIRPFSPYATFSVARR